MLRERIVPQSEVTRAIVLEDSPGCAGARTEVVVCLGVVWVRVDAALELLRCGLEGVDTPAMLSGEIDTDMA